MSQPTPRRTVLLLGGSGLLGTALGHVLTEAGHDVRAPDRVRLDLTDPLADPQALAPWLDGADFAINAAYAKGRADLDPALAARINIDLPHRLAGACAARGVRAIHISSDGVFTGTAAPYDESRVPDANDPYGRDKIAAEPAACLILRASVIGPEQRGFTSLLCWLMRQSAPVTGFDNHLWNGLTSLAYARAVAAIIAQDLWVPGVRHLFSAPAMSKFELLRAIAAVAGLDTVITAKAAAQARDLRLETIHPTFHAALAIPPLPDQLAELPQFMDRRGEWRGAGG